MQITIKWRFIVGIDISKKRLDIHLVDRKTGHGLACHVPNNQHGFTKLRQWLESHGADKSQTKLISEHTGRYGEHLLRWTTEVGWPHAVVKTTALEKVSWEHHRKTDGFDASQLAEYGDRFSGRLRLTQAPKPAVGQIKRLQAERRRMVDRRAALKAKLSEAGTHDADLQQLTEMWAEQVELLSAHLDELEDRIKEQLASDPALYQRHQTMRTAPGMGKVLGALWVSLHAGQKSLEPRKVSSRFGFAPHPRRSGSSVRGSEQSSGFGNSEVRRVMHQAALSVKTHYSHYQNYYNRKRTEGKPHLLVINNIINKLIDLYCAMWNNEAEYDPNYIDKMKEQRKKSA
jgi:transposase